MQAIETVYKGYRFRSRLEARWAVFFDYLNLEWEYEKEGFEHGGIKYLPDFYFPAVDRYVEIKPKPERYIPFYKIYLAGKMNAEWRENLLLDLKNNFQEWFFCGPDSYKDHDLGQRFVVDECFSQVADCDIFFANFSDEDSPGTLIELGYARALEKKIYCRFENENVFNNLWFVTGVTDDYDEEAGGDIGACFKKYLTPITSDFIKCRMLSEQSDKMVFMFRGDPMNCSSVLFSRGFENDWRDDTLDHMLNVFFHTKQLNIRKAAEFSRSARFEHGEHGGR